MSEIRIENPDRRPLPFGFGTHGYFRVPLGPGGQASECRVHVPAKTSWELDKLLPTGRELPTPVPELLDGTFRIGETKLDHVLGDVQFDGEWCTTQVIDVAAGRVLRVRFDSGFAACVVFNPPHREAFCIEPYTTIPDPFSSAGARHRSAPGHVGTGGVEDPASRCNSTSRGRCAGTSRKRARCNSSAQKKIRQPAVLSTTGYRL